MRFPCLLLCTSSFRPQRGCPLCSKVATLPCPLTHLCASHLLVFMTTIQAFASQSPLPLTSVIIRVGDVSVARHSFRVGHSASQNQTGLHVWSGHRIPWADAGLDIIHWLFFLGSGVTGVAPLPNPSPPVFVPALVYMSMTFIPVHLPVGRCWG